MMLRFPLLWLLFPISALSQELPEDTLLSTQLPAVVVSAFGQSTAPERSAAPIASLTSQRLRQFGPAQLVSAVNTLPGIRMEERSPGSHRFSIRGSNLRSPFGVRNVKVYYNDIPFTNPGGHTYLNHLGYYHFGRLTVIKGPAGSRYGAGTGGVLLFHYPSPEDTSSLRLELAGGSFGQIQAFGQLNLGAIGKRSVLSYHLQKSEGYRDHSALERHTAVWTGDYKMGRTGKLRMTALLGHLDYQTPGGLTAEDYTRNPKAARPGNASFPGAAAAKAGVQQSTALIGGSYTRNLTTDLQSKTVLYGAYTRLRNPTVQNHALILEPNFGLRQVLQYQKAVGRGRLQLDGGLEWQKGYTNVKVNDNLEGEPGDLQDQYDVENRLYSLFFQAAYQLQGWQVQAGLSSNQLRVAQENLYRTRTRLKKDFQNSIIPRFALQKQWKHLNVYASVSGGFAPPTTEEIFPSGGQHQPDLQAENGTSYDLGLRARAGRWHFDINAFYFALENSLSQRRTPGGGAYYVNAGSADQKGLESQVVYEQRIDRTWISYLEFRGSHTWHQFRYRSFLQEQEDYSGNRIPGVPEHLVTLGLHLGFPKGFSLQSNWMYSDAMPLDDANTVYAGSFQLLQLQLGWQTSLGAWELRVCGGVDNLLDEQYSLGNDVNAFGGRYFNAAPGRNYYVTLAVSR